MNIKILFFVLLLFTPCHCLKNIRRAPLNKRIKYSFKLFYKNQKELIDVSKEGATQIILEVIKDDIVNDIIYFSKLYNLINDDEKSYAYIFMYEFLTVMRRNENNPKISIPLYMSNVITYVLFKTFILNKILHNIHI